MNFTPPQSWLRPAKAGAPEAGERRAPFAEGTRATGQVPLAAGGHEAWQQQSLFTGQPVPTCAVRLCRTRARWQDVRFAVSDFTREAMAMAHLRFAHDARLGRLLAEEREAADTLDVHDPRALHITAHCGAELVACVRILLPNAGDKHAWQQQLSGPYASLVGARRPAGEISRLVMAQGAQGWALWRGMLQAAAYVLLQAGRRYAFVSAPATQLGTWQQFGFAKTALGGYVPSAKPHVTHVLCADLGALLTGHGKNFWAWHNLFSGTYDALHEAARTAGNAAPHWSLPLCHGLSRALEALREPRRRIDAVLRR